MSWNYPPGVSELPGDGEVEQEYILEVYGEVSITAYSEEDAERKLKDDAKYRLWEAWVDGKIKII